MTQKIYMYFMLIWVGGIHASKSVEVPPCFVLSTPNSILTHKEEYEPLPLANRKRYATCTGVAWLDDRTLAMLNLYGQHLQIYSFDERQGVVSLLQEINNNQHAQFTFPENLAVSPDRTLMLIANSRPGSVALYSMNPDLTINPEPLTMIPYKGLVHNVRFTPNGAFCACASFNKSMSICVYKIVIHESQLGLELVYTRGVNSRLRAKAITFTADGAYAITAYGLTLQDSMQYPMMGIIEVYTFDQQKGTLKEKICQVSGPFAYEDLLLLDSRGVLLVTDQYNDKILMYRFDVHTGYIHPDYTVIENPYAQLSFPHGLGMSPDGKYLAVTNYGNDAVNIYRLPSE